MIEHRRERNNYKEIYVKNKMRKGGQVTIFIIVGIVIVVAGTAVYMFYPEISSVFSGDLSPSVYLRDCIEPSLNENVELLSKQGGYSDPETTGGFITYGGNNVKYLCYTSEYYLSCIVQQPMIKNHFEQELNSLVREKTETCVQELLSEYDRRGYEVSGGESVSSSVEILPGEMDFLISAPMSVTKGSTTTFNNFEVVIPSKMYEILMISQNIVGWESSVIGNVEPISYSRYYDSIDVVRNELGDGSTIFVVKDVVSGEEFTFASRSQAWPAGLGLEA